MTIATTRLEGGEHPTVVGTTSSLGDSRLAEQFVELSLRQFPTKLDSIDWQKVSDHLAPFVRKILGSVNVEPPHEI